MRTHQEIDERSLALHRLVSDKIRRDPALLDVARETLGRWRTLVGASSQPYLAMWDGILSDGLETCLAALVEESQRATALRQSSPFCGILTNRERFSFLKEWQRKHEPQRA